MLSNPPSWVPLAHGDPAQAPPVSAAALLAEWRPDIVPLLGIAAALVAYLLPVWALRARGDHWSRWRTASYVIGGCGGIAVATVSPLAAYDTSLLSVHMVQHLVLTMVAPVFLALGAPVTLWLRTLPASPRSRLLAVLHSRIAQALTFAPVALAIYVVSPWALYFSGWYEASLRSELLHELTHLHFLATGAVFCWPLIGLDPVPGRVAHGFRVLLTFVTLPFHAFLGVAIMGSGTLIASDWYLSLERDWPPTPAADQELAGALLWVSGDLVGVLFVGVLFWQWVRASQREAVREDRRLDRLDRIAGAPVPTRPADSIEP